MYQSLIDTLSEEVSPNYLDSIHSTGSMIFKYALSKTLIKTNPLEHFSMPKKKEVVSEEDEESEVFLEGEELEEFLNVTIDFGLPNDLLIFTTLAYSGLRIGELVALKWNDIDFVENTLRVNKTYYNPTNHKSKFELLTPKTKGSKRIIDMDETVIKMFNEHKRLQKQLIMKNRLFYHDENFIFTGAEGYPLPLKLVMTRLQRLLKKMNINM
ncbi:site-specific integrase [Desulfosporosinus orientis]|uniref:site-specific integrase n=1 Tax=Desulfosporosinus orientis TaxID=1563 RepID=UPI0002EDF1F1|nr:site-specific integrase [Desulfosporosinus orientis]